MGVTNIWPLALGVLIPGIILLYLLKVRAVTKKVPALNLWKEAYENIQAGSPWEKFRHHLLMYLQILALLLLILALMKPYLRLQGGDVSRAVVCLDLSGSMNASYNKDHSKFEEEKRQAKKYISRLRQGTKVTIITADRGAKILANDMTDQSGLNKMIDRLQPTDAEGNLQVAVNMASSLARNWDAYRMVGFTDENVDLGNVNGDIIDLSSRYGNCFLDWVNHQETEQGIEIQVKIANQSADRVSHEINLYLGEQLYDVQSLRLEGNESQVVTFPELSAARFQELTADAPYIRAEINEEDGLQEDNNTYEVLNSASQQRILLVSEQNQFLEKALSLGGEVSLEKTTSVKNINPKKEYDLIVYDGQMPKRWYHSENVLILAPKKAVAIDGNTIIQPAGKEENREIKVLSGDLLSGMEEFRFACSQTQKFRLPKWGYSFMNTGDDCVAYTGSLDGRNITVFGFDLHDSNLPVQMEFPILMQNILSQGGQADRLMASKVSPLDTADLICSQDVQKVTWISPDSTKKTAEPENGHAVYTDTGRAGLYCVSIKKEREKVQQYFTVVFPTTESQFKQSIEVTGKKGEKQDASDTVEQVYGLYSLLKPILIFLLLLLVAEWLIYRRKQPIFGSKTGKIMAYALRVLVILLVIGAFFDISWNWRAKKVATVFLLDASDSMRGNQDEEVEELAAAIEELPRGEEAGVVAFGGDTMIQQLVSEKPEFSALDSMPITTETNIEQAVQTALSLYSEYNRKRLVLLTDGRQNTGDLLNMSSSLQAAQVDLQVKKWESTPKEEVYLSDLTVPESISVGDRYNIELEVESTIHTGAKLQLYNDNKLRREETVDLQEGSNRFSFQDTRTEEGFTNYRAVVIPDQDTVQMNNEYVAYTEASEKKPILLLEGRNGEAAEFRKVLDAAAYPYQVLSPAEAPAGVKELNKYVTILLENVYVDDLPAGFMDSVESYVKDYGGGLIAIGGDQSFALGGYRDTVLEKILPVNMDHREEEELPELAMVMVIDHSSSMSSNSDGKMKLQTAKEAAAGALKNLRDQDQIGVLAFDDSYSWVVKPQKLTERDEINKKIMGIREGGSTSIYPALQQAYKAVKETDAQIKHVILLTDGQDAGQQNYDKLLANAEQDGITVSTVAVGQDADDKLLQHIAGLGNGRDYQTDGDELSRIFAQEIYLSQGDFLINRDFTPVITADSDIMDGLEDGLPQLRGYIGTSIKNGASAVWMDDKKEDPILAVWQYGLGTTIAFTSDVTNEWTGNYALWDEYPQFWSQVIAQSIYDQDDSESKISAKQEGNTGIIRYENAKVSGDAKLTAIYTNSAGEQEEVKLDAVSAHAYEGKIPLGETGVYSINVRRKEGEELKEAANVQLTMQYSEEYRYTGDSNILERFVAEADGIFIDDLQEIYQTKPQEADSRTNLTMPFLMLAVVLWLLDILNRRLPFLADGIWLQRLQKRRSVRREKRLERKGERQASEEKAGKRTADRKAENRMLEVTEEKQLLEENVSAKAEQMQESMTGDTEKKGRRTKKRKQKEEPELLNIESLLQKQKERNQK